jgi:hypothetical protein
MATTLRNTGAAPLALGRCELLRIPRAALPAAGLRLLQYPLQLAQLPMAMVEVGRDPLSCNSVAMLHTPAPAAVGGCVGFLTWRRCATIVEVQADVVVAYCDASGYALPAGQSIVLETAWLSDWAAPARVWDTWPSLAGAAMDARLPARGRA